MSRGALTPADEEIEFIRTQDVVILARHLQEDVMSRIELNWRMTEAGKHYVGDCQCFDTRHNSSGHSQHGHASSEQL